MKAPRCLPIMVKPFNNSRAILFVWDANCSRVVRGGLLSAIHNASMPPLLKRNMSTIVRRPVSSPIQPQFRRTRSGESNDIKHIPTHAVKNHHRETKPLLGTKATWLAVTNVPPLATLDDVLMEIQRVVTTELKRGIMDLTRIEVLLYDNLTNTHSATADNIESKVYNTDSDNIEINISLQDEDEDEEDEEDGCEEENEPVNSHSMFPLWTPNNIENVPSHLVLEAHIMLSTLARPMGWYLKFPDRSVVHAILQHLEEAEQLRDSFNKGQKKKRILRKKELKKKTLLDADDEGRSIQSDSNIQEWTGDPREDDEKQHPHDFYNEQDQELFSWEHHTTRPLICAGKELTVAPFFFFEQMSSSIPTAIDSTHDSTISPPTPTKDDILSVSRMLRIPFYHQYKTLVDETVVRVENCSLDSTVDDVRYFFRRFDLKHNPMTSSIPAILSIEGPLQSEEHPSVSTNDAAQHTDTLNLKTSPIQSSHKSTFKNEKKIPFNLSTITPITTKTFLVRFQTSANARAAIRELQYAEFMGRKVKMAQYSRQIVA